MSRWRFHAAKCSGICFHSFLALTSAHFSINSRAVLVWSFTAAKCSGVHWYAAFGVDLGAQRTAQLEVGPFIKASDRRRQAGGKLNENGNLLLPRLLRFGFSYLLAGMLCESTFFKASVIRSVQINRICGQMSPKINKEDKTGDRCARSWWADTDMHFWGFRCWCGRLLGPR